MWFKELTGFQEENPKQVRSNIDIDGNKLVSKVNNSKFICGQLEIPTLQELRNKISLDKYKSKIKISEIVGNVQEFHTDIENNGAFFQAASQFNLLEMVSPSVIPEEGVGIYEHDFTQGPACAIACGAGTIYRNYFSKVNNQIGQSSNNQIDCLKNIGKELENDKLNLWKMSNGYALANIKGLKTISDKLNNFSTQDYENLKGKLRIGLQIDTEVTISKDKNIVTQAYCSALPVAYSNMASDYWEDFARLILEATYEASFYAALLNFEKTGNNKVFLTLVGGGAFGNRSLWIFDSIRKAIVRFSDVPLDIKIVSYGNSNHELQKFINSLNN